MPEQSVVLDHIPFTVDLPAALQALHVAEDGEDAAIVRAMAQQAESIARPRAVYRVCYIDAKADDHIVVEGTQLSSRVLRVNLDTAQRVFAYVATAGMELQEWADGQQDIVEQFWAEGIMLQAVRTAMVALSEHLQERYRPGRLARMNPGSLTDWPLREQRPLFGLLGDVEQQIGVRLTDSCLMVPRKSVSGIQFPTQESFESCQLCGREVCPGRRAPYDPQLFDRKYRQQAT